nr:MAG TPA: hypothetical protein [Caudoviricetes sp.]
MALKLTNIYAPLLGHRWNKLPVRYTKRIYLDIDDNGVGITPSGKEVRTISDQFGVRGIFGISGRTVCQQWMDENEMVVLDPFNKTVYVVPTYNSMHCNARDLVMANLATNYDLSPVDLSKLWVDQKAGEVGLYAEEIDMSAPRMVRKINGSWLLALREDDDKNLVIHSDSYLAKYARFISGVSDTVPSDGWDGYCCLLTRYGQLSTFGQAMAKWIEGLSPEAKEVLCDPIH